MIDYVKITILAVAVSVVFGSGYWAGYSKYVAYKKEVEIADEVALIATERQRVSEQHPYEGDHADDDHALAEHGQERFLPEHASIEEGHRRGHHEDQCRGDQQPGGVPALEHIGGPIGRRDRSGK